ncbi:MAG: hypothetical protein Tp136SUR676911_35 [Prokaryotic dsDNA virus sp.]|jgi:hypothetical protein|nr:MAG: hypothetical protein Tp136SUR676911_35 [Prokaryotic dsDNA virus sp.]|tara:strand:- start:23257 stop:23820 length:564 start_codon:yes stop_codon:yes gene_type:complete
MIDIPQAVIDAMRHDLPVAHLVTVQVGDSEYYFTEAAFDIEFGGNTFLGNGLILDMGTPKYSAELRVNQISVNFSGADLTMNALLLNNSGALNKRLFVDRVWLDSSSQPVGDYAMRLNNWRIVGSGSKENPNGESVVSLKVASELADWKKPAGRRTTPASQQRFYPGDKGFEFAAAVQKEVIWGARD